MYIPQLTFPRFVACMFVLAHHFGKGAWPFNLWPFSQLTQEAGWGLTYFFVLSGFVMALVYFRPENKGQIDKKKYWVARFARISPLYYFAFLVTLFSAMYLKSQYPKGLTIILQTFAVQAWTPGHQLAINFPAWSISVEVFFYLLFPWVLAWFGTKKDSRIILWALVIWAASLGILLTMYKVIWPQNTSEWIGEFILRLPLWHMNSFVMGMVGGIIYRKYFAKPQKTFNWAGIAFLATCALWIGLILIPNPISPYATNGLPAIIFTPMILFLALDKSFLSKIMGIKPFVYLGEITYGLYILQYPVWLWTERWFPSMGIEPRESLGFWLYILVLTLVSILCFELLEKPTRNFIRKKWG